MEIADIFVVNKSDRPDADQFVKNLRLMLAPTFSQTQWEVPVVKTVASAKTGISDLAEKIAEHQQFQEIRHRKAWLLAERAYQLIQRHRMRDIQKTQIKEAIENNLSKGNFNLFTFIQQYF